MGEGKYLMLGRDTEKNWNSIAQFSKKDADAFVEYEKFLENVRDMVEPLLDGPPPNIFEGSWRTRVDASKLLWKLLQKGIQHRDTLVPFYELFTAPAAHILNRWFESDILKCTL